MAPNLLRSLHRYGADRIAAAADGVPRLRRRSGVLADRGPSRAAQRGGRRGDQASMVVLIHERPVAAQLLFALLHDTVAHPPIAERSKGQFHALVEPILR